MSLELGLLTAVVIAGLGILLNAYLEKRRDDRMRAEMAVIYGDLKKAVEAKS